VKRSTFGQYLVFSLFLLCLGVWGWSYPFREHLDYKAGPTGLQTWFVEIGNGAITIGRNFGGYVGGAEDLPGWHYWHLGRDTRYASELDTLGFRLLGFQLFTSHAATQRPVAYVEIPFWFVSTVMGFLFLWRGPNLRNKPSRGFAVVMTREEGKE
jgi:hypothetical protein